MFTRINLLFTASPSVFKKRVVIRVCIREVYNSGGKRPDFLAVRSAAHRAVLRFSENFAGFGNYFLLAQSV